MPAHRQEYRGAPGFPETRTGASQPSQGPSGQRAGTGAGGRSQFHPSRIAIDEWKPDSSSQGPALRSPDCNPPPLIVASGNGMAAIRLCFGHRRRLASVIRRDATGGKSSLTVAATNIGDGSERPIHLTSGQCTFGSMAACSTAVPAHGNGGGQARLEEPLYGCFFVGGSGPARSAPAVRPSAQPFSPASAFHCDGAHINPCGPTGCRQALHQCQTQGDAHEATRAGIARPRPAEEPGPGAPGPVSKLRAPGFHTTAQTPRTPEQRDT